MPLRGIAGSGFRTDSVESDFVLQKSYWSCRSERIAPAVDFFVRFVSGRFGWSERSEDRTLYRFVATRAFVCSSGSVSGAQENRSPDRRVSLPERETLFFGGADCGVCVGSIRPRSRCSGFAIAVRGVCGRGIAAVSDAVYSRAAIRSGCNRRFLSLYEY